MTDTQTTVVQGTSALVDLIEGHHDAVLKPLDDEGAPGVYLVDRHQGRTVETLDLRPLLAFPIQQQGTTLLHTGESLIDWTSSHRLRDPSTRLVQRTAQGDLAAEDYLPGEPGPLDVYADVDSLTVVSVLDPHRPSLPAWQKFRGSLTLRRTPAWRAWCDIDGKTLEQEQFAHFVQDQASTIAEPPAMDLQEIAETLQMNVGVKVSSAVRIRDGQRQIKFEESTDARAGAELTTTIPEIITLRLPLFEGDDPEEILVRLIYRNQQGQVRMGIKIVDRADRELQKFHETCNAIGDALGVTVVFGKAP
jgi:hypothetical protein